jgi:hypothetical protein
MPLTNFPNGLSSFGIPIIGGGSIPPFTGTYFFVKPYTGSDGNTGKSPAKAFKTLAKALDAATADKNDVVFLVQESNTDGYTTDYQSAALDWNKDGVHLVGIGAAPVIGSRCRIAQTATVKTIEDLFTVSADNCLIANLEIFQGVASATATLERAMVVSGSRNKIVNCQISGIGDLSMDDAGSCSLAVTGAENHFINCYIGLDTVLRTTSVSEVNISTSATRTIFENCIINSYVASAATTFKALTIAAGSYHTATWLKNCMLCSETNRTGATAAQTGAILHSAAGNVFILDGGVFGYVDVSTLANAAIFMLAHYGLSTAANFPGVAQGIAPS